jgi:hypothetical protein
MGAVVLFSGCMPKMTLQEMKAMMEEANPRPAELDKLESFIGEWVGSGEAYFPMSDETVKFTGTQKNTWGGDKWYMIEEFHGEMDIFGSHIGHSLWTWNAKKKRFMTAWVGNDGSVGHGTVKFDEKCNCWCMTAKSRGPMGDSVGEGCITFTDPDTMTWTWSEYDSLKMTKFMEMKGTSKRQ